MLVVTLEYPRWISSVAVMACLRNDGAAIGDFMSFAMPRRGEFWIYRPADFCLREIWDWRV